MTSLSIAAFVFVACLLFTTVPAKVLHFLAFGDSLTEGFHDKGRQFHPYEKQLTKLLEANHYHAKVTQKGVSGERVLLSMKDRLEGLLKQAEADDAKYDWCIILGGINDIGRLSHSARVFEGLQELYNLCIQHGANVLAMTCMEWAQDLNSSREKERQALNKRLREWYEEVKGQGKVTLLDLEKAIPYWSIAEEERKAVWDDGLHLTPAGYDKMGELIYKALEHHLPPKGSFEGLGRRLRG